ncbi:MAG: phosphate acyltransferase, partial [Ottowia sp.]|nr:phosphate acyltransferase [Ottowia sp.]
QTANIFVCDSRGLVYGGREGVSEQKARYAQGSTQPATLAEVIAGADVFLGCSAPGVLTQAMVRSMAEKPIILALANPEPEIRPEDAKAARADCIIATGRSDYPNQVNNVLCFPYIFRGALDCGATKITEEMKLACVQEIAALTKAEISAEVAAVYVDKDLHFGPDYIIPTPFDPRLILRIAPAVARAAEASGVALRPITDFDAYHDDLMHFVYQTGMVMQPVLNAARTADAAHKRIAYAEGEDERILHAAQIALDDAIATPILIGRPAVIEQRIERAGLRMRLGVDVENVNPEDDPRFRQYWQAYHDLMAREGVSVEAAKAAVRRSGTTIAALMVHLGDADAMICGLVGKFDNHLEKVREIIGVAPGAPDLAGLNALMLHNRTLFITDSYVHDNPSAELLAAIARMAASEVYNFGIPPKVAFLSHSNFGSSRRPSALKMRHARDLFRALAPDVECDGEMHGDSALSAALRTRAMGDASTLSGEANLLVCPNLDAANILFNVLKMTAGSGITIGPMLLGAAAPAHVLTPSSTVRRVVNMTAVAIKEVQVRRQRAQAELAQAPSRS